MEMRKVLALELQKIMQINKYIIIINADLARAAGLSDLYEIFPERCFNVGVAEQNMAGVAAGFSSYGFIPFIFTFTPFATRRICDQIAISICYAKQNVKIFGLDPGIAAENNGGTHMSVEDVGVLRSIPKITIFEPCDEFQLKSALPEVISRDGAVYVRLFRKECVSIFDENYKFSFLKADKLREGADVSVFCTGLMVEESILAAEELAKSGISAEVINIHTVKPIDKESIIASVRKTGRAVTAENHNIIGGLYSAVSEVLSLNCPAPMRSVGINDEFGQVGRIQFLKSYYGMTKNVIVNKVMELLNEKK
ncbi:MAG: transketolase family protein [Oscillospiraceae bacterium]|jgi:transketolase|nr:transketolase family protein [Oscillospiraceae bacterium]